jgi:hypothetical protein
MDLVAERATDSPRTLKRRWVSFASLAIFATVLTSVLFIATCSPMKDDIAWLLYVAHKWMSGGTLYLDLIEVNPPLIIWLSAVPLALARWWHLPPNLVTMSLFIMFVLACAWWAASLLQRRGGLFSERLPVFAVIGTTMLLLPGPDLGQREHLLVAAFVPYMVLIAAALDDQKPAPAMAAAAAGVLAGLFCGLKPLYAACFLALESLVLIKGQRPWRTMPIAAGLTLAAYVLLIIVLCPAYLKHAVPMALALYGATDVSFVALLSDSMVLLTGEAVAFVLLSLRWKTMEHRSLMLVLVTFGITSTIVCFADGKDWYYHRIPATIATVLALILWGANELNQRHWRIKPTLVAAMLAVMVFCVSSIKQMEPEFQDALAPRHSAVDRIEGILRAEHAKSYIAFSEWIALGFPVVNNTGVTWASRFDSMWALKGEIWRTGFDPAAAREWPIARWVTHDFIAGCPDIAVVDTREPISFINVLRIADPAFARVWSRYRKIDAFDGLVVYKRAAGGCLDVWVAAGAPTGLVLR